MARLRVPARGPGLRSDASHSGRAVRTGTGSAGRPRPGGRRSTSRPGGRFSGACVGVCGRGGPGRVKAGERAGKHAEAHGLGRTRTRYMPPHRCTGSRALPAQRSGKPEMLTLLCSVALVSSCFPSVISFPHHNTLSTLHTNRRISLYYDKVVKTFAAGNASALTELFAKNITQPMRIGEIFDWADGFFASNGPSTFIIENLELERIDAESAVTLLTYQVKTVGNKGDFSGIERDYLIKMDGEWVVSAWDKVD